MKKLHLVLTLALAVFAMAVSRENVSAQQGQNWGNMDPAQMQQMIQQRLATTIRERFAVTNDDEWNIIEGRLTKVVQLKMETVFSSMGGFGGMMGGNRGGNGQAGGRGGFPGFGQPSPEADALQSTIDANAPTAQIRAALERFREAHKKKQAELTSAQDQLRQVLSMRQEAILALMGLMD